MKLLGLIPNTCFNILTEGMESDYYVKKTTPDEVADLLLRGHYLEAWPFAGSDFKNYIYGIYIRSSANKTALLGLDVATNDSLVGCVVYGYAEPHASSYVSKWVRGLLNPDETVDSIYDNLRNIVKKDSEEEVKAKQRGYEYKSKAKPVVLNLLNSTNIQDAQILELKRLYILPKFDTKNIESFSIAKANEFIFQDNPMVQAILSFSDSRVGHHGGIYQATNAVYAGITKHKLHRYVYLRDSLTNLIKKYRTAYDELVFNYPKKDDLKTPIQKLGPVDNKTKGERASLVALKTKLASLTDPALKTAYQNVINHLEQPEQGMFDLRKQKK